MRLPVIIVAKQPCFLNRTCAESVSLASMAFESCTAQDDVRDAGVEAEESDEALLDLVARGGGRCGRCGRCGWGSSPEGQRPDTRLGAAPGRGEGEAAEDACRAHLPCTTCDYLWQRSAAACALDLQRELELAACKTLEKSESIINFFGRFGAN